MSRIYYYYDDDFFLKNSFLFSLCAQARNTLSAAEAKRRAATSLR